MLGRQRWNAALLVQRRHPLSGPCPVTRMLLSVTVARISPSLHVAGWLRMDAMFSSNRAFHREAFHRNSLYETSGIFLTNPHPGHQLATNQPTFQAPPRHDGQPASCRSYVTICVCITSPD